MTDWLARDRASVWHPYAPAHHDDPLYLVERANGVRLSLADGRELLDGMSSWWSAVHGYNHPALNAAAVEQLGSMSHVMFGGLTHRPAIELAEQLLALAPGAMARVFFVDSGSVAVEVALKMALQYWQARKQPEKRRVLALAGGYHGDTFQAMSVCDPVTGMHHLFAGTLTPQLFAPRPQARFGELLSQAEYDHLEALFAEHHHQLAACIVEPIVQGAGGMWFYSAEYLAALRALCDRYQVLLIADEVATGFGRSGRMFACEYALTSPDILCLGKALTGGYMSMAATLCTAQVADTISTGEAGALMHGPTFMANPLAANVALASLRLLQQSDCLSQVRRLEAGLQQGLQAAVHWPQVAEVRVLGAIGVIEWRTAVDMSRLQPLLVAHGVWVRPFGRLVYLMPPLVMNDDDLAVLCAGTLAALEEYRHA